jgi:hypothetical protein
MSGWERCGPRRCSGAGATARPRCACALQTRHAPGAASPPMHGAAQGRARANRIFYLSIPPSIFTDVAACASEAASSASGWNRVIVEKPFGRDLASFQELSAELSKSLTEDQMFRIDHYLGKELIENLTARAPGAAARALQGVCKRCA